jgi:hypothetical protein
MKIKALRPQPYVKQLRCDRCRRLADEGEWEFLEFAAIEYTAGYGSILGDGNRVAIDLCQHCLKEILSPWLRITDPFDSDENLQHALERFNPDQHGGEFPMRQETPAIDAMHTENVKDESTPMPPDGFRSWLDYAVANFDVRSAQQTYLLNKEEAPSRDSIRAALQREVAELIPAVVSNSRANEQMQAGSEGSKPKSLSLSLNGQELMALAKFAHEATCQGDFQLCATPTGLGTTLRVTCSKNCRPDLDITDYSVW